MNAVVSSPLPGEVRLGVRLDDEGRVCEIDILPASTPLRSTAEFLHDFFDGRETTIPLAPVGTAFQRRVWSALRDIPRGTTKTYGELASELNSSARAVAGACRANPIPLLIPCHRVVAADGIGGYGGETVGANIELKRWLLEHERQA